MRSSTRCSTSAGDARVDKVLTTEELRNLSEVSSSAENAELNEFSGEDLIFSDIEAEQNLGRGE